MSVFEVKYEIAKNILPPPPGTTRKRMLLPFLMLVSFLALFHTTAWKTNYQWIYVFGFAWSLAVLLTPLAIRLSFKWNWLDRPAGRKDHAQATPLLGGAVIFGAFEIAVLSTLQFSREMKGVGLASIIVWIIGLLDDKIHLSAKIKLVAQVVAVAVMGYFGVSVKVFDPTVWGMVGNYFFTAFWVIGITNAINFLDGMDGLCTGFSLIVSGFLALIAIQSDQIYFAITAIALCGACLGLLPYNLRIGKNALIFIGDSGATFLGFLLAAITVMGDWADNRNVSLVVPIVLLAVPIYDTTLTTIVRIAKGQVRSFGDWLAFTGRDHIHHRLAALGIGRHAAVFVIYVVTCICGLSAAVLKQARGVDALLILMQVFLIFLLLTYFIINVRAKQIQIFAKTFFPKDGTDETRETAIADVFSKSDRSIFEKPRGNLHP